MILGDSGRTDGKYDVILCLDQMKHEPEALSLLKRFSDTLKNEGILILSTRVGSGFDILTLRGNIGDVYPYEYVLLPSVIGLEILLNAAGFDVLEISTPGSLDVANVFRRKEAIQKDNLFFAYMLDTLTNTTLQEFQRFLQKNCLSSHARIIARRRKLG